MVAIPILLALYRRFFAESELPTLSFFLILSIYPVSFDYPIAGDRGVPDGRDDCYGVRQEAEKRF